MSFVNNDVLVNKETGVVAVYFQQRTFQISDGRKESFGIKCLPSKWTKVGTLKEWYKDMMSSTNPTINVPALATPTMMAGYNTSRMLVDDSEECPF